MELVFPMFGKGSVEDPCWPALQALTEEGEKDLTQPFEGVSESEDEKILTHTISHLLRLTVITSGPGLVYPDDPEDVTAREKRRYKEDAAAIIGDHSGVTLLPTSITKTAICLQLCQHTKRVTGTASSFSFCRASLEHTLSAEELSYQLPRRAGGSNLTWHDGRGQKTAHTRTVKLLQQPGTEGIQV
ncbi:unnamed protein product [Pleuronectes platessa]|uniref:Uncharacterized protein n=1 Tax=Pleuronectes platessa TaxID=8262 RepID=A0A9N7Z6D1_PLEPL|nr:unnamed protein product [Pleuronectes platessa]